MDRKTSELLQDRQLTSYMNDTKWRELCAGILELPFPPAYRAKLLSQDAPLGPELDDAPSYWGDWGFTPEAALGVHIEWLEVAPRFKQHRGRLIPPKILDCSAELRALLKQLRIPFVERQGVFRIYGHAPAMLFD